MTDVEVVKFIHYWTSRGVRLPNPTNYPKCFEYYVKLYKLRKEK